MKMKKKKKKKMFDKIAYLIFDMIGFLGRAF
jgi:hypothetical protein